MTAGMTPPRFEDYLESFLNTKNGWSRIQDRFGMEFKFNQEKPHDVFIKIAYNSKNDKLNCRVVYLNSFGSLYKDFIPPKDVMDITSKITDEVAMESFLNELLIVIFTETQTKYNKIHKSEGIHIEYNFPKRQSVN